MWTKFIHKDIGKNIKSVFILDVLWIELEQSEAIEFLKKYTLGFDNYLISEYNTKPIISNVEEYGFLIPQLSDNTEFTARVINKEQLISNFGYQESS